MGKLDRLLGLDDGGEPAVRAPIWKRALWRAIKRVTREQPKTVANAALGAIGYATKQSAIEAVQTVLPGASPARLKCELTDAQKSELIQTVGQHDLKQLAELAPGSSDNK
jgi:hypothetical protein